MLPDSYHEARAAKARAEAPAPPACPDCGEPWRPSSSEPRCPSCGLSLEDLEAAADFIDRRETR